MKIKFSGSAFALATLVVGNIQAAEDAVIVTASRFPESALEAPVGLTVISADRIANHTAATLPELLSQEAGIVARDANGSPDRQIDMRGFGVTGDQNTLVLLNGQRLNEIELTSLRWSAIPLEDIERIEIMRGSGAVLYGGGAVGGAINIITRAPRTNTKETALGASAGSHGTRAWRARVNMGGERTALALHYSDLSTDNYRYNNRLEQQNFGGEWRADAGMSHVALKFGVDNQSLRLPGERTAAELQSDPRGSRRMGDYSSRDGTRVSLGGGTNLAIGEFAAELGYRDSARAALLKDYSTGAFDTYTDTRYRVWSFTPRLRMPLRAFGLEHSLVLGMDADDWDYDSRRAGSPAALSSPTAHIRADQQNQAFYVQNHTALSAATKLVLGLRHQRAQMTAADRINTPAYARGTRTSAPRAWEASLRHKLTPATAIHGRIGQSFRIATVDESYSQFGGPAGDAKVTLLEPQRSRDRELGIEYRNARLHARASAFDMKLENEIHYFSPTFSNINLPPTRRRGLEFDARYAWSGTLSLYGNLSFTQAKFRSGAIGGFNVAGKHVPMVPRQTANAGFAWRFAERSRLNGALRRVGEQYYDNDQLNTFPSRMPAYNVIDLKVTHEQGDWSLALALNNLQDRRYYTYAIRNGAGTSFNTYPQAGRTLLATLELRLR